MWIKATDTHLFQFTIPGFSFGQCVETQDGLIGYVVGLDFYPETRTWSYGIYVINPSNHCIEEIWYEAEQLKTIAQHQATSAESSQSVQSAFDQVSGDFAQGS